MYNSDVRRDEGEVDAENVMDKLYWLTPFQIDEPEGSDDWRSARQRETGRLI